jgi:acyl-CoA thioesterase-2
MDIQSAWPEHPGYAIDLVPVPQRGRVWAGDLLVAESTACLRVQESPYEGIPHVDRLYFPEIDVRWEHFEPTGTHTVCPFKGQADYWTLTATDPPEVDVVWGYRTPFEEVAGIAGYVCFYHERLRVELVDEWPEEGPLATSTTQFPTWGDASDLIALVDVQPAAPGRFVGLTYRDTARNVVEGGHMLAQAIVAGAKTVPDQRVASAHMVFSKSAAFDAELDVEVEVLRGGRTFSTVEVKINQASSMRSAGLLLFDTGAPDVMRHAAEMPDVGPPAHAVHLDAFRTSGREIRVVDEGYHPDPDRIGPPVIHAWCRFRHSPAEQYLHSALLAQSTTHWTVAAAMRPHAGFGESMAHSTLSTGAITITVAFLEDVDVTQWLLYTNPAVFAGNGLVQGEGRVFTEDGRLVATYSCHGMVRAFGRDPSAMGLDWSNAM